MPVNSQCWKRQWFVFPPSTSIIKICLFSPPELEVYDSFPVLKYLLWLTCSVVCRMLSWLGTCDLLAEYSREKLISFSSISHNYSCFLTHVSLTSSAATCFQSPTPSLSPGLLRTAVMLRTLGWGREKGWFLSHSDAQEQTHIQKWVPFTNCHKGVLRTSPDHALINHNITSGPNHTVVPTSKDQRPPFTKIVLKRNGIIWTRETFKKQNEEIMHVFYLHFAFPCFF